jgi:hypothetical protein
MTGVFSDKYGTLDSLFEDIGDDIFEKLCFVPQIVETIDKGVDLLHGCNKFDQFLVSSKLSFDDLYWGVRF